MRKFWKSGLMLAFAAALMAVLGMGIWGLASDEPSPLKDAALNVTRPVQKAFTDAWDWIARMHPKIQKAYKEAGCA